VPLVKGKLNLVIYADRIGFEIFTADGLVFMPVNVNLDMNNKRLSVAGGKLNQLLVYALASIWDQGCVYTP
jgi:hypothetical protein